MAEDRFDCVIVGARCAGAPLATHLARAGMKVCMLDSDKIPSDQPFSTHAISPLGMDFLDELGVGQKIRAVTPMVRTARISVGAATLDFPLPMGRTMRCPRRSVLDPLLAETATQAGAELRDETTVLDVLREGDRVVGVRARHGGRTRDVRARVVVGADGRNSTIAKRVGAEEYLAADGERGGYWAYFPNTSAFRNLPFQQYIEIRGTSVRFAFETDSNLVIAGALDRPSVAKGWSKDPDRHVMAVLRSSDMLRTLVQGNRAVTKHVGILKGHWFFRTPVGPGWALVGDAGLHKDPTPGYGITDALRDAKALSKALIDGREAALENYWRKRDVESIPFYENALLMGSLTYDNPLNELVLTNVSRNPALIERLRLTFERELSPFEAIPAWRVLAWAGAALVRGKTEILPHFAAAGERGRRVAKELAVRQALLAQAEARLAAS